MTKETESNDLGDTKITKQSRFSAIWLIPILALAFGSWLAYKNISERGTFITIEFDSASGIVPGKTQIRYKGLTAGLVKSVRLADDFNKVLVTVEIKSLQPEVLTDQTKFWYVTANISIDGVSGLDTLLSGAYISILPDIAMAGGAQDHFIALSEPPSLSMSTPGLHLQLMTKELNSIRPNTNIRYKQLKVGYVTNYRYEKDSDHIIINAFIEPEYAHLVKENTRFWNSSGIDFTASISTGVKLRTESIESMLSGGIAFDTLPYLDPEPMAKNGQNFDLYNDFDSAQTGHELDLFFNWDTGFKPGALIMYKGIVAGKVIKLIDINQEKRIIHARAYIDPRAKPYLTDSTQFYIESLQISLAAGVKNIGAALGAATIEYIPGKPGEAKSSFKVLTAKPAYNYTEPGLHLELVVDDLDSLTLNSKIFYQKEIVGSIQKITHLMAGGAKLQIHILPKYVSLVNHDSRFWNTSGVRLSGNLQGFEIQSQSMASIISGGIAFATIKGAGNKEQKIKNGDEFVLHANADHAKESIKISLYTAAVKNITPGVTKVFYQGVVVGSVHKMSVQYQKNRAKLTLGLLPEFAYVLRKNTKFWLTLPTLSLSGISDTQALLGGAYISFKAGAGAKRNRFTLNDTPPLMNIKDNGLQLVLESDNANSLSVGSPVLYRDIKVGRLDSFRLADNGKYVVSNITIAPRYRRLINGHTRFFNASGITVNGSLAGIDVNTGSLDSILRGGISFYNPPAGRKLKPVTEGSKFSLYSTKNVAQTAGLPITIDFTQAKGLRKGDKIKYQQQQIGQITRLQFDHKMQGVKVFALLNDHAKSLAVVGSKFWIATPKLGLVGSKNLDALLTTYISFKPGNGAVKTDFSGDDSEPVTDSLPQGLNVTLVASKLGSVRAGDPVLYKQVNVGEVIGVDLSPQANEVLIFINILNKYAPLVKSGSKFWNASGIKIEAGLLSGVDIKTESLEAILAGGIAFATPNNKAKAAINGEQYKLYQEPKGDWGNWQPIIRLNR